MNCFNLRATTVDNEYFDFTMSDLPAPISGDEFVLLNKPSTPILKLDYVLRGDPDTNLYEGDVIRDPEGGLWLVCYERGFYLINEDYVIKYLSDLSDWEVVPVFERPALNIPITFKREQLFKYKRVVFKMRAIVGANDGKLLVNSYVEPIDPADVQQDCCMLIDRKRIFLGDRVKAGRVVLHHGRLSARAGKDKYVPL